MNLRNGGFEQGSNFWTLATTCPVNGASIDTVAANARGGSRSLRLQGRTFGPTCGTAAQQAGLDEALRLGKPHELIYWVKNEVTQNVRSLQVIIAGSLALVMNQELPVYSRIAIPFTPTVGTPEVKFEVLSGSGPGGTIWRIDDVRVRETKSMMQQILEAIDTAVGRASLIKKHAIGIDHGWMSETVFPAAYTYLIGENKSGAPTRSKSSQMHAGIYVVLQSTTPEQDFAAIYREIEEEVESELTFDGLVRDVWITGTAPLQTAHDIAQGKHVSDIFVRVEYQHDRGQP